MSRFAEYDGELDELDVEEFEQEYRFAYRQAHDQLRAFLAYLDAMPVKHIINDRFIKPKTDELCAVAAYCACTGFDRVKLLEVEKQSRLQRLFGEEGLVFGERGSEEFDGWEGPTVDAGVRAGLPPIVAYDLGFRTDLAWDRTPCGFTEIRESGGVLVKHQVYRKMTPQERWRKLRNYIAGKLGESLV